MLRRRIRTLAVAVTIALAAGLTGLGANTASAATTAPAVGPPLKDAVIVSLAAAYLNVQTTGHQNPVILSDTGSSYISETNCTTHDFPRNGYQVVCLLENEAGLCLDASTAYDYITAESCQPNDTQELWWREFTSEENVYWFINAYWSNSTADSYMTAEGLAPGGYLGSWPPGYGSKAEWYAV